MSGARDLAPKPAAPPAKTSPPKANAQADLSLVPDEMLAQLQHLRAITSDAEFARFLRLNDWQLQSVLGVYGWHGSWADDSGYLRDFANVRDSLSTKTSRPATVFPSAPAKKAVEQPKPEPPEKPRSHRGKDDLPLQARMMLPSPPDAKFTWKQDGTRLVINERITREGLHALLITTMETEPIRITSRRLFRSDDFQNKDWTEVTKQAAHEGLVMVDWNMPDLRTDKERIRDMENPGLVYALLPSMVSPYLRDQSAGIRNPYLRMQVKPGLQAARATTVVTGDLVEYAVTNVLPEAGAAVKGLHQAVTIGAKASKPVSTALLFAPRAAKPTAEQVAELTAKMSAKPVAKEVAAEAAPAIAQSAAKTAKPVVSEVAAEVAPTAATTAAKAAKPAGDNFIKRNLRKIVAATQIGLSNADEVAMRTGTTTVTQVERAGARTAAKATERAAGSTIKPATTTTQQAVKPAVQQAAQPAVTQTIQGSARPVAGQALVGSSRAQMRRAALRIIAGAASHPLRFLLDARGRFHSQDGLTEHHNLADHPELIQMGHIVSDKLGGPEKLMLQGAWENQLNNVSIEGPRVGGAVLSQEAVSIGGIAVDKRTAQFWEDIGWLPRGTVAGAPKVIP